MKGSIQKSDEAMSQLIITKPCVVSSIEFSILFHTSCRYSQASFSTRILLDNVQCSSSEPMLSMCTHNGFGVNNCLHSEDVAVSCSSSSSSAGMQVAFHYIDPLSFKCDIPMTSHHGNGLISLLRRVGG